MLRKFVISFLVVGVLLIFAQSMYSLYRTYQLEQEEAERRAALAAQIDMRTQELTRLFQNQLTNVEDHQLRQGFWYTLETADGEENIFYFDVRDLAQGGVSDQDAAQLAESIRNAHITNANKMRVLDNDELPSTLQFHNSVYTFGQTGNIYELRDQLQRRVNTGQYTAEDLFRLSYLYELTGDYKMRNAIRTKSCEEFGTACVNGSVVTITGRVVAVDGTPVQSADVVVLSRPEVSGVETDEQGEFALELQVTELEKVRLGVQKRNFSEGVASVIIATLAKESYEVEPVVLQSPITIVTVDTDAETVTGEQNAFNADGSFVIRTNRSTYEVPAGAVVHEDGGAYAGEIDVYLYEFTKETVPDGLITVDTFDAVTGYAGDLMKTFGMPYIQFFTPEGEELHVLASQPMRLTYQIPHMQELYENSDNIYRALTDADMQRLVAATIASRGYPIDREFLIGNGLLHFPAFWVFDRASGVWENVGIRVNNVDGEIQSPFYTINNLDN